MGGRGGITTPDDHENQVVTATSNPSGLVGTTPNRRKNYILHILLETKKLLIIVKFDYYEPFVYYVGYALRTSPTIIAKVTIKKAQLSILAIVFSIPS
jgi:hypothetical protein